MKSFLILDNKHVFWKVLLILQLLFTFMDLNRMLTEPVILQPTHPVYVSVIIFVLDQLVTFANIGVIMRFYIFRPWFWQFILIVQPVVLAIALYFEFNAGGYSFNDKLNYVNFGIILLYFFLLPVAKYSKDIKQLNDSNKTPQMEAN